MLGPVWFCSINRIITVEGETGRVGETDEVGVGVSVCIGDNVTGRVSDSKELDDIESVEDGEDIMKPRMDMKQACVADTALCVNDGQFKIMLGAIKYLKRWRTGSLASFRGREQFSSFSNDRSCNKQWAVYGHAGDHHFGFCNIWVCFVGKSG